MRKRAAESESLNRGPSGMWHDTVGAELSGAVLAGATALAYYAAARRRGDKEPHKALIPGIKMGLVLGAVPYIGGALLGSMSGYPSTSYMNKLESNDWPSYVLPGRAGYRSGKRVRYLIEVARRNQDTLKKLKTPETPEMSGVETLMHPTLV